MIEAGPVGGGAPVGSPAALGLAAAVVVGRAPATGWTACGWTFGIAASCVADAWRAVVADPDPHPAMARAKMTVVARRLID